MGSEAHTHLKDHVQPDCRYIRIQPRFRFARCLLDPFGREIVIVDNERFGHIAISQVYDGRATKESCVLS